MPILGKELSLYPEALLDGMTCEPSPRQWWVLYTKARQEKALSRDLHKCLIPFYLPMVKRTSRGRTRRVTSYVPLFSGYLFMFGTDEERIRSLGTNRVSRVLLIDDPVRLLHELRQLRRLIETDAPLTLERRLVRGNRVRVRSGLFEGLEGTVLTRRGRVRLLVSVNFLQQGASVEIEDYLLERLG